MAAALAKVPAGAISWRPEPSEWAVDEVIWHCADIEGLYVSRLALMLASNAPVLIGLDQEPLAEAQRGFDKPVETAMAFIDAARAFTLCTLRQLPADIWNRVGLHSEMGAWTLDNLLESAGTHLQIHSEQIDKNVAAWNAKQGQG